MIKITDIWIDVCFVLLNSFHCLWLKTTNAEKRSFLDTNIANISENKHMRWLRLAFDLFTHIVSYDNTFFWRHQSLNGGRGVSEASAKTHPSPHPPPTCTNNCFINTKKSVNPPLLICKYYFRSILTTFILNLNIICILYVPQ